MKTTSVVALLSALAIVLVSPSAAGHGGGLDRHGCHTNRKTGDYHCHGGGASSAPAPAPVRASAMAPATQRVSAPAVKVEARATSPERDLVRAAQVLLRALGYEPSMLGSLDARTQVAVRAFQRAEQLDVNGAVDMFLVVRLAERVATKCR